MQKNGKIPTVKCPKCKANFTIGITDEDLRLLIKQRLNKKQ